jgi:aspyridone synthetase trans-acting enoyl reductase
MADSCVESIKLYTKNSLSLVVDCIGTAQSAILCYGAIGRAGGRYVALEKFPDAVTQSRKVVKASWAMAPLMFGNKIAMGEYSFEVDEEAREFARWWFALVERLVSDGSIRSHPVNVVDEGDWTKSVLSGLERLKTGSVSGQKLVVSLD